jgi:hypothetical protein
VVEKNQQTNMSTHEFEKAVIEAATIGDLNSISGLLEQYNQDVRAIDFTR